MEFFSAVFCITQRICSILHFEGKVVTIRPLSNKSQFPMGANHLGGRHQQILCLCFVVVGPKEHFSVFVYIRNGDVSRGLL